MCLAIPGIIKSINGETAEVDYNGITREAETVFFPDLKTGDFVLVHAGFVIQVLDPDDGEELSKLIEETGL